MREALAGRNIGQSDQLGRQRIGLPAGVARGPGCAEHCSGPSSTEGPIGQGVAHQESADSDECEYQGQRRDRDSEWESKALHRCAPWRKMLTLCAWDVAGPSVTC